MNFDVWPQKNKISAASSAHHRPRDQPDDSASKPAGGSSRQPSRYSQSALKCAKMFISHPRNNRLKKNKPVFRSMQKNAQPRLTRTKVTIQDANWRSLCLTFSGASPWLRSLPDGEGWGEGEET